ncbi:MAG: tetratricopeptide repeat protein [Bacteroidales bacterium]|nr:tetratricopeptide repeat protein [Bacteroidales bacterium]
MRYTKLTGYVAAAVLLLASAASLAAQTLTTEEVGRRLTQAKNLYNDGMYVAAEKELDYLSQNMPDKRSLLYSEVMANKIMCAIALGREDIDGLVKNLETDFPNDPQLAVLKMNLAGSKFDSQDYAQALVMYEGIHPHNLYKSAHSEFYFKKSYCSIYAGKYEAALDGFQKVIGRPLSQYTYPSIYYSGYVNYLTHKFEDAFSFFNEAKVDARFRELSEYYMVECKFMVKDYDYTIENGPRLYDKVTPEQKSDLSRMVAESYYAKGRSTEAMTHLRYYIDSGVQLSRKDLYFVGVLSYSLGSYKEAVQSLSKVTGDEDQLGQSAWYYAANSYLKLRNKVAAMDAFRHAGATSFDAVVQEDALFNYAKLAFDVNSDISAFEDYVRRYPDSGKDDVFNNYIAVSFLSHKDYSSAIEALHKVNHPTDEGLQNLQKALVLRSVELISDGSYRQAAPLLEEAIALNTAPDITQVGKFYLAECLFNEGDWRAALDLQGELMVTPSFERTGLSDVLRYNYAYSCFKCGDYGSAEKYFRKYLESEPESELYAKDAGLRLADSQFLLGRYGDAAMQYENVASTIPDGDLYPMYQSAVSYGLAGKDGSKVQMLKKAVAGSHDSPLYTQSLFELGRTYVQQGKPADAKGCFREIIDSRDSLYYGRSLLELAMIGANAGDYQSALAYYDKVVRQLPGTAESRDALAGIESIYEMQNKPREYFAYLDKVGLSNFKTSDQKEAMVFNAAEQIYFSRNYSSAIRAFNSYLESYPEGENVAQSYWYIAESYRNQGRKEFAADAYESMIAAGGEQHLAEAVGHLADISYDLGHWDKAAASYDTLSGLTEDVETVNRAKVGKMLSLFGGRRYMKAIKEAEPLRDESVYGTEITRKADFVSAKSYASLGNRDAARPIFEKLGRNANDEIGAESNYCLIEDLYNTGDFSAMENAVYAFSDMKSPYSYWLAKSFIVLGDSFADRGQWEQAKATFESIRDGYTPGDSQDDVMEQVEMRLSKINSK